MRRLLLGADDFAKLVAGEIVDTRLNDETPVQVMLSDIGWVAMVRAIGKAFPGTLNNPDVTT